MAILQEENFSSVKDFSLRLRQIMESKRFRGRNIAEVLGVSDSTVSAWKNGANFPDARHWHKLAWYLRVDPFYLFCGEPNKDSAKKWVSGDAPVELSADGTRIIHAATEEETSEKYRGQEVQTPVSIDDHGQQEMISAPGSKAPFRYSPSSKKAMRDAITDHVERYLDKAELDPVGLPFAYKMVMKTLRLDDFDDPLEG